MVLVPLGQLCITNVDGNGIVVTSSMVGELPAIRNLFSNHHAFSRTNDILFLNLLYNYNKGELDDKQGNPLDCRAHIQFPDGLLCRVRLYVWSVSNITCGAVSF